MKYMSILSGSLVRNEAAPTRHSLPSVVLPFQRRRAPLAQAKSPFHAQMSLKGDLTFLILSIGIPLSPSSNRI